MTISESDKNYALNLSTASEGTAMTLQFYYRTDDVLERDRMEKEIKEAINRFTDKKNK